MEALVFVPRKDFKDESFTTVVNMLKKWDIKPIIGSYNTSTCYGYHGLTIKPDVDITYANPSQYSLLVLIDGPGIEEEKLYDSRQIADFIRLFNDLNRPILAIDSSVGLLAKANIIKDQKIANIDNDEIKKTIKLFRGYITENSIEESKNIYTVKNWKEVSNAMDKILKKINVK